MLSYNISDAIKNSSSNNNYYYIPRTTAEKTINNRRQGDVTVVIEIGIKALDRHIERLEAKLSYIIRSYDDSHTDLLYQYDKKIATVQQEIDDAIEQRRR
jgi:hypothetical protein